MAYQVLNSILSFLLLLSLTEITPASALAPRAGARVFLNRKIRQRLEQRVFSKAEKQKFVPVHGLALAAEQMQTNASACMVKEKTGFWFVGCYADKDPDNLRM